MFTGLIREIARAKVKGDRVVINAKYRPSLGDSVAVNGACLSVVDIFDGGFMVEVSHETKRVISLENYTGNVHIEPAMRLSDRIEGHILQGHVDCLGEVKKLEKQGENYDIFIKLPKEFIKFVAPKGSIAIDGVSLTVNEVFSDNFRLTIIPITYKNSIIKEYIKGRRVNIETDMFARYIYHIFKKDKNYSWSDIDRVMSLW